MPAAATAITTYRFDVSPLLRHKRQRDIVCSRLERSKVKADIALHGNPISELYGTSLAIWDHTVLPATRHK